MFGKQGHSHRIHPCRNLLLPSVLLLVGTFGECLAFRYVEVINSLSHSPVLSCSTADLTYISVLSLSLGIILSASVVAIFYAFVLPSFRSTRSLRVLYGWQNLRWALLLIIGLAACVWSLQHSCGYGRGVFFPNRQPNTSLRNGAMYPLSVLLITVLMAFTVRWAGKKWLSVAASSEFFAHHLPEIKVSAILSSMTGSIGMFFEKVS